MTPSEITDLLFPHDQPHSKICLRCRLTLLRVAVYCAYHGYSIASGCNCCAFSLLPHELIEWAGRPVSESAIREMMIPYLALTRRNEWFQHAAAKTLNKYGEFARKHHPRGDVPNEIIRAVGRFFVWTAEDMRLCDDIPKDMRRDYSIEQFLL